MKGSKLLSPFGLRIQPELKDWLKHKAIDNRRSLNGEIEHRLEQSRKLEQQQEVA